VKDELEFLISPSLSLLFSAGTITSLTFPTPAYLLTTSFDSRLNLYRVRDWALLRTLRGHIGRVNSATSHPSGRVALSVGEDKTIRMWDLMRGKGAASIKIDFEAIGIKFNWNGNLFAVFGDEEVRVYDVEMKLKSRLGKVRDGKRMKYLEICWWNTGGKELLLVGSEDKLCRVWELLDGEGEIKGDGMGKGKGKEIVEDEFENLNGEEDLIPLKEIGRLVGHENR